MVHGTSLQGGNGDARKKKSKCKNGHISMGTKTIRKKGHARERKDGKVSQLP